MSMWIGKAKCDFRMISAMGESAPQSRLFRGYAARSGSARSGSVIPVVVARLMGLKSYDRSRLLGGTGPNVDTRHMPARL